MSVKTGRDPLLGWNSALAGMPARIRGSAAYILGKRFLNIHKKPKPAADLFRIARDEKLGGESVRKLAQAELDHLKTK
jgi:hypothetical protein